MRKLVVAVGLAGGLMLLAVGLAYADAGPHKAYTISSDSCAGCHRTHTAQADKLLKTSGNDLCLGCHDGTGASTDTWDGARLNPELTDRATGGSPAGIIGALRGGGFVYARIDSANTTAPGAAFPTPDGTATVVPGVVVNSSHIKFSGNGLTAQNTIWGWGSVNATPVAGKDISASPLSCADCHNPHGGNTWRILRPSPRQSDATPVTLAVQPTPVTTATPKAVYVTDNYWTLYQVGSSPEKWGSGDINAWCSTCHTRYEANTTEMRVDSTDAIFRYRHVSDGTNSMGNQTGAPYGAASFEAACLQCHVAHGSNAVYSGTHTSSPEIDWPGTTTARGNETTLLKINNRGTCVACHGTTPGS